VCAHYPYTGWRRHGGANATGAALRRQLSSTPSTDKLDKTGALGTDAGPYGYPNVIFPATAWAWQKAAPKTSLSELPTPQQQTATPCWLNIIEAIHWFSFPLGFAVARYMFSNATVLAGGLPGACGMDRVFCIILGLLCQVSFEHSGSQLSIHLATAPHTLPHSPP
jgi:hypothetical protein